MKKTIKIFGFGKKISSGDYIVASFKINQDKTIKQITGHLSSEGFKHYDIFDFEWKKESFKKVGINSKKEYEIVGYLEVNFKKKTYFFEKLKKEYEEFILNEISKMTIKKFNIKKEFMKE